MINETTPKGLRLHIGIFGRRNAGKSTLLNMVTRQNVSIVSNQAGTTTDPVEKPMELLPIGPVLFIDTAGIDDTGDLGKLRTARTRQVFDRTDIALLVLDLSRSLKGELIWDTFEEDLFAEFTKRQIPILAVLNKSDTAPPADNLLDFLTKKELPSITLSHQPVTVSDGRSADGTALLRDAILTLLPDDFIHPHPIVSDLLPPGGTAVLVTPIDKEAPKGRLILPQVQTIRDLLDGKMTAVVTQVEQLPDVLARLSTPPDLVVTDSQAFHQVDEILPAAIPLTSFSILFARQKGELGTMVDGAGQLGKLGADARILIAEACTHHPIAEDIGTVKIPHLLRKRLGDQIEIRHVQGHQFPETDEELARWDLVIHCGACVWNRREMLRRIIRALSAGVPITNYGLALAWLNGILDKAVLPLRLKEEQR